MPAVNVIRELGISITSRGASVHRAEPRDAHRRQPNQLDTWRYYRRHILNGCFGKIANEEAQVILRKA